MKIKRSWENGGEDNEPLSEKLPVAFAEARRQHRMQQRQEPAKRLSSAMIGISIVAAFLPLSIVAAIT